MWEGEIVDRLHPERHPDVWYISGGLESDAALKADVWVETVTEGGRRPRGEKKR